MEDQQKLYYQVYMDVVLKAKNIVFGFINISHIPYSKLDELFRDQVKHERFLFDDSMSYWIDKKLYKQHKAFLDAEIPFLFDFKLFDYSVNLTGTKAGKYKPDYYEELPPFFSK
jgi:hypothetical protein